MLFANGARSMGDGPRAFVTGWPISHSRSPFIHGHWLAEHGIAGSYERIAVEPADLAEFLEGLARDNFSGGNVTLPHKESAFAAIGRRDAAAETIGAVNTLWFEDGRLCGGNTDAYGFAANLDVQLPGWRDGTQALVLGAGGAALAVVHALLEAGIGHVAVVNRTLDRAEALAARFGARVSAHGEDMAAMLLLRTDLLVNTRSHQAGVDALPDLGGLHAAALVSDIVYVPLETPLLVAAKARGLATSDGIGMLLHQAVPGFERWFGVRPKVTPALRAAILAGVS